MHHLMIRGVVESYSLFIPDQPLAFGDFSEMLTRRFADSFQLGVQPASPFLLVAMVYYIGLGIPGRLMPALPVFIVVMPIQIVGQIGFLMLTLSTMMMMYFLSKFEAIIAAIDFSCQKYSQFRQMKMSKPEVNDEIDEEVPAEHYMAVAEDIGYVMRMRGELPPAAPGQ